MSTPSNFTISKRSKYIAESVDQVDDHLVMVDRDLSSVFSVIQKPVDGSRLTSLSNIASTAGIIPAANLPTSTGATSYKVGFFTFDVTSASGTTSSNAGIGFKPQAVNLSGAIPGSGLVSYNGFDDGTNHFCLALNTTILFDGGNSIHLQAGADQQTAFVTSFNSDGFVVSWTKGGSPTGTAYIGYIAYK